MDHLVGARVTCWRCGHGNTVPGSCDIHSQQVTSRVHVNFVGKQDHLRDGAAQMAPVWLCAAYPDGLLRGAVKRPHGADHPVSGLVGTRNQTMPATSRNA